MSYTYEHVFAQPAKVVSINEISGRHWAVAARNFKTFWEKAGWAHGNELRHTLRKDRFQTPLEVPATIQFVFSVEGTRRRDGHNYAGTVCKWFIDGMVLAKVFKDDTTEHLTLGDTTFRIVPHRAPKMGYITLTIEERP